MGKPNSYGSKANRARRKAVADENATKTIVSCSRDDCTPRHREGRHFPRSKPVTFTK